MKQLPEQSPSFPYVPNRAGVVPPPKELQGRLLVKKFEVRPQAVQPEVGRVLVESEERRTCMRFAAHPHGVALGAELERLGPSRDASSESPSLITRNTIGSPVAALRNGPFGPFGVQGSAARPAYAKGRRLTHRTERNGPDPTTVIRVRGGAGRHAFA